MPQLHDGKLEEEFEINKVLVFQEKYKTTDTVKMNFKFGLKA